MREKKLGGRRVTALVAGLLCMGVAFAPLTTPAIADEAPSGERYQVFHSDAADPVGAARVLAEINAVPPADDYWKPLVEPPVNDDARACPRARCRDYRLSVPRSVKVTTPMVRVILPTDYHRKKSKRYPVVYLFNGALSDYKAWSRKTMLTSMSRRMSAIFVMPEGGHNDAAGMFTDWHDGSYDWETFHTKYVVPWVDRRFRTIRGARVAAGASMGSIGAFNYAAHHPGMFKSVVSFSGLVDTTVAAANTLPPELASVLGLPANDMTRVWGNPVLNRDVWSRHNPVEQVSKLRGVDLFITQGTGALTRTNAANFAHTGVTESALWNLHRRLFLELTLAGVSYHARITEGGVHNWPYFHDAMLWALPKAIAAARR